jgi:reactive intermediate/imine deaminase
VRVSAGPLLFVAGQIATDVEGRIVGVGDLRAQARQVLENIRAIVRAHGADMQDVVNVTVYVTDMRAFHDIADIRLEYFPHDGPASAIVEVARLALPEILIEISAVAAVP